MNISSLPLDSLLIRNFRAFKELEVERLGRVNLVVGKNNVGKTSLLEAVMLYMYRGFPRRLLVCFMTARKSSSNLHEARLDQMGRRGMLPCGIYSMAALTYSKEKNTR